MISFVLIIFISYFSGVLCLFLRAEETPTNCSTSNSNIVSTTRQLAAISVPATIFSDFEEILYSQAGGFGVGATDNSGFSGTVRTFDYHFDKITVQTIIINNCGGNVFYNIKITWFNQHSVTIGDPTPNGCSEEPVAFTFQPGEMLAPGSFFTMSANSGAVSYIKFTTTLGRTFTTGGLNNNKYFETIGQYPRFLTGFCGYADSVDGGKVWDLAPYFSKGIANYVTTDLSFPSFSSALPSQATAVAQESFTNPSPIGQQMAYQVTELHSHTGCFTQAFTEGFKVGTKITFTAGIPLIATNTATLELEFNFAATQTYQNCDTNSQTIAQTFNCAVPAFSSCTCTIAQYYVYSTNVPFNMKILISFADSSYIAIPSSGVWTGTTASNAIESISCYGLVPTPIPTALPSANPTANPTTLPTPLPSTVPTPPPTTMPTTEPTKKK